MAEEKKSETKEKVEEKNDNNIPELKPGMTIRVYQKIKELNIKGEEKERVQYFEGMIIAMKHGQEAGATITVRKVSNGVGVEKIFPLNLPTIEKIEIKKQAKVRQAKLGYLKKGYKKRLKETIVGTNAKK
jgi:large subunit ribosomal protein L19